jgi:hypothetical protein
MKLHFPRDFSNKYWTIKFNENPSSGSGSTDGQTDMTKLIVAFRNFANAPINGLDDPNPNIGNNIMTMVHLILYRKKLFRSVWSCRWTPYFHTIILPPSWGRALSGLYMCVCAYVRVSAINHVQAQAFQVPNKIH